MFKSFRKVEKDQPRDDAHSARVATHWLRQAVIGAYPSIGAPETRDFERVSLLREWASQAILQAKDSSCSLHDMVPDIRNEDVCTIFYRMARLEGGFLCGGASKALQDLYELFGYRARCYNMGKTNVTADGRNGSHVVTLVHIEHKGEPVLSIQDATHNCTLVDRNGDPLSFDTLIELLIKRRVEEAVIKEGQLLTRRHLYPEDPAPGKTRSRHFTDKKILEDGRALTFREFRLSMLNERMYPRYGQWIKDIIGDDNILYLFLFPLLSARERIGDPEVAAGVAAARVHIGGLAAKR